MRCGLPTRHRIVLWFFGKSPEPWKCLNKIRWHCVSMVSLRGNHWTIWRTGPAARACHRLGGSCRTSTIGSVVSTSSIAVGSEPLQRSRKHYHGDGSGPSAYIHDAGFKTACAGFRRSLCQQSSQEAVPNLMNPGLCAGVSTPRTTLSEPRQIRETKSRKRLDSLGFVNSG